MSRYRISVLLILAAIMLPIYVHSNQNGLYGEDVRGDRTKPTVYLRFKEYVYKQTPGRKSKIIDGARFELYNNTRWILYYRIAPEEVPPGDIPVIYNVEKSNGCFISSFARGDTNMTSNIKAGEMISFIVLQNHLSAPGKIYVPFNYEWEIDRGNPIHYNELRHRVYFSLKDLPKG
jgi:hypothetical protein